MVDQEQNSVPVIAVTAAVGAVVLLLMLLFGIGKKDNKSENEQEEGEDQKKPTQPQKTQPKGKKEKSSIRKRDSKAVFSHPWLSTTLRYHSGQVLGLDFSPNGKYLITCADDRSVLLWHTKEFSQKEHKSIRGNVSLDHATQVKFSPDSKAFITSLYNGNTVRIFKMSKKADGSSVSIQAGDDFEEKYDAHLMNIGISASGRFIMTGYKDTIVKIWSLKGDLLHTIDTRQMNNWYAATSPCGRFVASSGFTPDVKVWEVVFDKSGGFKEVVRAFELKGHTSGIYSFGFSQSSHRMATVSKDGTWKVFDTDIQYAKNQDPYLLLTGKSVNTGESLLALSPDGRTVAIATGSHVALYNAINGDLAQNFQDVFQGAVTAVAFDLSSRYLVAAGDKHVAVFHNVVGYSATVLDLEQQKAKAHNQAFRERCQKQIVEAQEALKAFETEA